MTTEFRLNEDGTLDEVFLDGAKFFHLEQMDTNSWWIGVTMPDDNMVHIYLTADKGLLVNAVDEGPGGKSYLGGVGAKKRLARVKT